VPIELPPKLWVPPAPAIIRPAREPIIPASLVPLMPFRQAAAKASANLVASPASSVGVNTSYSFTSVGVGSPAGTSLVAVEIFAYSSTKGHNSLSACAIDGTNGTIHVQTFAEGAAAVDVICAIVSRATSNTSITIAPTFGTTMDACLIRVYRLQNLTSATPDATTSSTTGTGATGTSCSSTMNILANGIALQAVQSYQPTLGSIAGADQDSSGQSNPTLGNFSARSKSLMSAETPRTFSAAVSPATLLCSVAATWH